MLHFPGVVPNTSRFLSGSGTHRWITEPVPSEQRGESGGLKVPVVGKGVGDLQPTHDNE